MSRFEGKSKRACVYLTLLALIAIVFEPCAQLDVAASSATRQLARVDRSEEVNLTTDSDDGDSDDTSAVSAGSSRSDGGETVSPLPFIIILWRTPRGIHWIRTDQKYKNYLNGLAIRLNTRHVLAYIESVLRTANDEAHFTPEEVEKWLGASPSYVEYDPQQTINVTHGINGGPKPKGFIFEHLVTLNENVALWHLTPRTRIPDDPIFAELPLYRMNQYPVLESNSSAPALNCYAYSYSSPLRKHSQVRTFSRWPVRLVGERKHEHDKLLMRLDWNNTDVQTNVKHRGRVCRSLSDAGAPVLCGGGLEGYPTIGKLSYVIVASREIDRDDDCFESFNVLRVADYYDRITGSYIKIM